MLRFQNTSVGQAMRFVHLLAFISIIVLGIFTSACFTTQAKSAPPRLFVPPPVELKPVQPATRPELQPGPDLDFGPPTHLAEIVELPMPELPAWQKPIPLPKRNPAPPKNTAPEPEVTPAPPKITQIFSDDQLRGYHQAYEESQERTKKALAILDRKRLNGVQKQAVERIRTFQTQAAQEYERDIVTAVNLARRADALSSDLLNRIR